MQIGFHIALMAVFLVMFAGAQQSNTVVTTTGPPKYVGDAKDYVDLFENATAGMNEYGSQNRHLTIVSAKTQTASFISLLWEQSYSNWTAADNMSMWMNSGFPVASEFYDAVEGSSTNISDIVAAANSGGDVGWQRILRINEVMEGDVLAVKYHGNSNTTGHVMIFLNATEVLANETQDPVVAGTVQYNVWVVDSTATYHGMWDTRAPPNTIGGIGAGVIRLYVSDGSSVGSTSAPAGEITGYAWSTSNASMHYDSASSSPTRRTLVIGRPLHLLERVEPNLFTELVMMANNSVEETTLPPVTTATSTTDAATTAVVTSATSTGGNTAATTVAVDATTNVDDVNTTDISQNSTTIDGGANFTNSTGGDSNSTGTNSTTEPSVETHQVRKKIKISGSQWGQLLEAGTRDQLKQTLQNDIARALQTIPENVIIVEMSLGSLIVEFDVIKLKATSNVEQDTDLLSNSMPESETLYQSVTKTPSTVSVVSSTTLSEAPVGTPSTPTPPTPQPPTAAPPQAPSTPQGPGGDSDELSAGSSCGRGCGILIAVVVFLTAVFIIVAVCVCKKPSGGAKEKKPFDPYTTPTV